MGKGVIISKMMNNLPDSQELKELNQWPLFLVTFRLDYASFLTEMEVDVKARSKATATPGTPELELAVC